ncbi:MAG: hypothetical protein Q9P01_14205 [Anaerolineae bacterium]|nr:hypothetical protein [Anaerolineae bacterium]
MGTYVLRRVLQGIPTFFGITLLAFMMMLFSPGDPVSLLTFNPRSGDTDSAERIRRQLGLDKPKVTQYIYWLIGNDWTQYDSDGDGTDISPGTRLWLIAWRHGRVIGSGSSRCHRFNF